MQHINARNGDTKSKCITDICLKTQKIKLAFFLITKAK